MRIAFLAAGLLIAIGSCGAQADPPAPPSPVAQTAESPDEIICHTMAAPTGSLIGAHRECHSRREWEQQREQAQQEINNAQQVGRTGGLPGN
jgi:hypothetical protein